MHYSIIIPAYNEAEELPATLKAVREAMSAQAVPGELIVVDNNSNDATGEIATENGADHVVFEPVNQIARARNTGARASTGRYLVFVDADTRIQPALLETALNRLASGESVGGGAIVEFEGPVTAVGKFGIGLWKCISKITQTAAGSFFFCRRDAFEAVQGFDEKLYAGEEVRLTQQLKRWGRPQGLLFKVIQTPPAQTSARKLDWYSGPQILGWMLLMMVFPIAVRSQRLCRFWYDRPD